MKNKKSNRATGQSQTAPKGSYYGKEDDFQISLMRYIKPSFPGRLIIHVPNGGSRGKAEAGIFKAMGVTAGVPDILIFDDRIFLELKVWPNKPTDEQLEVMAKLRSIGWIGDVFYGIDEAVKFLQTNIK